MPRSESSSVSVYLVALVLTITPVTRHEGVGPVGEFGRLLRVGWGNRAREK